MGTLTGSEELAATIGPALSGSGQAAWTLLPSYPTLEPAVKLLLDTPEYFTTYWNTCLQTVSAVGWSIGRGCSRRMGTLPA